MRFAQRLAAARLYQRVAQQLVGRPRGARAARFVFVVIVFAAAVVVIVVELPITT